MTHSFRTKLFRGLPRELGFPTNDAAPEVFGAVMDWVPDEAITVVALVNGDCNFYTSAHAATSGKPHSDHARNAALKFVRQAALTAGIFAPATDFAYPGSGRVRFYLLTRAGPRSVDYSMAELEKPACPAHGLFSFGQLVLTQLCVDIAQGS